MPIANATGPIYASDGQPADNCACCASADCGSPPDSFLVVVGGYTGPSLGCYVNLNPANHSSIKWLDTGTGAQVNGTRCFVAAGGGSYDGGAATVSHVLENHNEGFPPQADWSTCGPNSFASYGDNYSRTLTIFDNGDGTYSYELDIQCGGGAVFSGITTFTPSDPTRPYYDTITITNGVGAGRLPLISDSFGISDGGSATVTACCL